MGVLIAWSCEEGNSTEIVENGKQNQKALLGSEPMETVQGKLLKKGLTVILVSFIRRSVRNVPR
jgi:hypothetical protein